MGSHSASDFLLELKGYRLTTVEILYCLPDYPDLLQTFIWQNLDLSPDFPRLKTFLNFWENNIEGRLFRVTVAQADDMGRAETQFAKREFFLH
jgi:uncharacterized protein Usg